jgi:hypothetical protein
MVLWCVGFGDERRFAPPNYTGFALWETDPFERPNWGVISPSDSFPALVSGGGDEALQDVIRLATRKKSAIDVWQDIEAGGWSLPNDVRHALLPVGEINYPTKISGAPGLALPEARQEPRPRRG